MIYNSKCKDRGIVVIVGFTLVIMICIVAFSLYLNGAVPNQTMSEEKDSYDQVKLSMIELNDVISTVKSNGVSQTQTFNFNVDYPLFYIPDEPTQGINFVDSQIDISDGGTTYSYDTGIIEYKPNYYEIDPQDVIVEQSMTVGDTEDTQILLAGSQTLIDGTEINITEIESDYNKYNNSTIQPTVIREEAISTTSVSGDLVVTVKTKISENIWENQLQDQYDENGGHITSINYSTASDLNTLSIELESDTYTIQSGKVSVR